MSARDTQIIQFPYPPYSNRSVCLETFTGDFIGRCIQEQQCFYEIALFEIYEAMYARPKTVLDVGANVGNHSIYWSLACGAQVYAFEPNPDIFPLLQRNVQLNQLDERVHLFNYACGASQQSIAMEIPDSQNSGTSRVAEGSDANSEQHAQMVVLDTFLAAHRPMHPFDLVKIDTEGYELDVLRGMHRILCEDRPNVWVEVGEGQFREVNALLEGCGLYVRGRAKGGSDNFFYSAAPPRPLASLRARIRASLFRSRLSRRMAAIVRKTSCL